MIGLLVTGSHELARGTVPPAPHRGFWRRMFDWFRGW